MSHVKFKVRKDLSPKGTSFVTYLDCTNEQIEKCFGELPEGLDEKYSESIVLTAEGEEVVEAKNIFDDTKGIYTVYALYGAWRIGGSSENKYTEELKQLIETA